MSRWFWISLGISIGGFFAARAMKSINQTQTKNASSRPAGSGAPISPLQNALNVLQNSAEQGMNAMNQVTALQGLLAAKNDNDPAYDTTMRNLSPETKSTMQATYRAMAKEKRNERGTIVFLIGREIKTEDDLKFLEEVLNEPPCLSLESCDTDLGMDAHIDSESGVDTTLIYPQLVAIKSLGAFAGSQSAASPDMKSTARIFLERTGNNHSSEKVRQEAIAALSATFN